LTSAAAIRFKFTTGRRQDRFLLPDRRAPTPPEEMSADRSHQLSDDSEYLIRIAQSDGAGSVLDDPSSDALVM